MIENRIDKRSMSNHKSPSTNPAMRRPLYIIFNVIYQVIICWLLIILNAFYNELLIPERLVHSSAKVGLKILIALAEGAILLLMVYGINRGVLNDINGKGSEKSIANRTVIVQSIITAVLVISENLH
jgi:hypothetical protein